MTATASPKELLASHRTEKRLEAATHNAPLDRSVFPGLRCEATGMIYLRAKSLTYRSMFAAGTEALTPEKLADLLTREGTSTVVADPPSPSSWSWPTICPQTISSP